MRDGSAWTHADDGTLPTKSTSSYQMETEDDHGGNADGPSQTGDTEMLTSAADRGHPETHPLSLPDRQAADYVRFLAIADPLADAVAAEFASLPSGAGRRMLEKALRDGIDAVTDAPQTLRDLFAQLDDIPLWVDWERLDRGGSVFLRSGALGIAVLSLYSLPLTYSSPNGNKPLVFTGHLLKRAPRRMAETASFAVAVSRPGGLTRFAEGFDIAVKVRLMHAQVRRLLWRSGRWNGSEWGTPINQIYMAGTNLSLSAVMLEGLERLGFRVTADEGDALLHLWRYSGYLSGVDPELLCSTRADARWLGNLIFAGEESPDDDSRALVEALMKSSYLPRLEGMRWREDIAYGLSRALIGDRLANALGYPKTAWRLALPASRPFVALGNSVLRIASPDRARATDLGLKTWEWTIQQIMAGSRAEFRAPSSLGTPSADTGAHHD